MKSHAFIGYFFEYSFVIIVTLRKSFILSSSLIMLFYLEVYLEVFIWKFLASNDQDLLVFTPWEVPSHRHQGGSVRTLEYRGHSGMSLPSLAHKGYCGLHCSYLSLYWNTLGDGSGCVMRSYECPILEVLSNLPKLQPWHMSWLLSHGKLWTRATQLNHFQNPDPKDCGISVYYLNLLNVRVIYYTAIIK